MENLVVGPSGGPLRAPDGTGVGRRDVPVNRLVWAGFSGRYQPSHPPGEACLFGMDFSFVLPGGAGIVSAGLAVFANTFARPPAPEWTVGPVAIRGSLVFARLSGGLEGTDYVLIWTVTDSDSNVWPRTSLVLCSPTS